MTQCRITHRPKGSACGYHDRVSFPRCELTASTGINQVVRRRGLSVESRLRVSRMLVDPGLSALMINGLQGPSTKDARRVEHSYTAAYKHKAFLPVLPLEPHGQRIQSQQSLLRGLRFG